MCVVDPEETAITTAGKCVASAGDGEDCAERPCQAGLQCESNEAGDALACAAVEPLDDGADCFDDGECASGLCEFEDTSACSDSGDPCEDDSDCDEENFEFCEFDSASVCAPRGQVEICDGQ